LKVALIVNPIAGQGRAIRVLPKVQKELQDHFELLVLQTQPDKDGLVLSQLALEENCQAVVTLGGDGTISQVINALAALKVPLGVVPCGTANVFANEMGIPRDPKKACRIILNGKTRQIDLGRADGQFFLLMAGAGFDANVVKDVNPDVKRMLKDLAYVITGVKTILTYRPSKMTVHVDEEPEQEGYFVVVGNARFYAGRFSVTKMASIEDGLLDICIFKNGEIRSFARYITGVLLGNHTGFSDVKYLRGRNVRIEATQPTLVQADGELIGELPMIFSVAPQALSVYSS